ncbi:MAG: hypothetical protein UW24_C0003G0038 [Parcubacteria group bacterium GW2011_GWA2_44_12]|nr:MAG: hypothetical protein UW24_C0003G0038 [Parcubacteria group bacterium GW2011_GWA2_44_12]
MPPQDHTNRDLFESAIFKHFKDTVKPISIKDISIINRFKNGTFTLSYLGYILYANGNNPRSLSTHNPQGLRYFDGENLFAIGFGAKENNTNCQGHAHITGIAGSRPVQTVDNFIHQMKDIHGIPQTSIYIRGLSKSLYEKFLSIEGYNPIEKDPWHPLAPQEDDTFNHRFIRIRDIIETTSDGKLTVKSLPTGRSKNFRKKTKGDYARFNHFLERNHLHIQISDSIQNCKKEAFKLVDNFFTFLKSNKNVNGSTSQDHKNLIYLFPIKKTNGVFFSYIGFLADKNQNLKFPVMLFIGEKISDNTCSLYATFTMRNPSNLPPSINPLGYTGVASYAYARILALLERHGIEYVDIGGSETKSMDSAKERRGAVAKESYWAVYIPSSAA